MTTIAYSPSVQKRLKKAQRQLAWAPIKRNKMAIASGALLIIFLIPTITLLMLAFQK